MKKQNIINLIKYWSEKNDAGFRNEAMLIARYFDKVGDHQLAQFITGLLATGDVLVPQEMIFESQFLKRIEVRNNQLPLPGVIVDDVKGILNAISHDAGINKFLFEGKPGTGKTETVKQVARLLGYELYQVEFSELIDSKLGQTAKNIIKIFNEINHMPNPHRSVVLFDEIDAIALDRINSNDLREMGRVTSTVLKEMDQLNDRVVLIGTTNLFKQLDKALVRRFDSVINFDRYTREDYVAIGEAILNKLMKKFNKAGQDIRLFKKIVRNMMDIPSPAELESRIKVALAFSNPDDKLDYLKRLVRHVVGAEEISMVDLSDKGFTVREIEILTGVSKSQVSRELKILEDAR